MNSRPAPAFPSLLGLAILATVMGFGFLGARGLYDPTEGRYAESAREMRETGAYLEPTLAYRPHWTKPPLTYWAIAGGMALFGETDFGVRFANGLAFALTVAAVAGIGAAWWDRRTGLLAGCIYATSPFPAYCATMLSTDTLLALWETLAVLAYAWAVRAQTPTRARGLVLAMWTCFGLAFLTKGPVALLPLMPILVWHRRRSRGVRLGDRTGLLLFLIVGISWYLVEAVRHPGLLSYFVGDEVVRRVTTATNRRNPEWYKPFLLYIPTLTLGAGAWLLLPAYTVWRRRRGTARTLSKLWRSADPEGFILLWIALPLLVFFLSRSRLPLYVLPLCVPVALALAHITLAAPPASGSPRLVVVVATATAILILGGRLAAGAYPDRHNARQLYEFCVAEVGADARYTLFNQRTAYGLQFYLGGKLTRVTPTGSETWVDGTLAEAIDAAEHATANAPATVIICRTKEVEHVRKSIAAVATAPWTFAENGAWTLCIRDQESARAHGPQAPQE